jgi:cystathionine gamma-synthase
MNHEDRSVVRRTIVPHSTTTALVNPLYASVAFCAEDTDQLHAVYEGRETGYTYAREAHPNAQVLAEKIAWMEGAETGVITSSGMAAVSAVLLGLLSKGDHIVAGNQLYGRSQRLFRHELPRLGFEASLVDASDIGAVERAIRAETKLIVIETVSNPTLRVADAEAIGHLAEKRGLMVVTDNTFSTPLGFKPLEWKAHIVIHSVTKLLAGHSDATLGFVGGSQAIMQPVADAMMTWGFNASPHDCWLAERGLNTLEVRFERAQSNAKALCRFLKGLPGVARVVYPGEEDHPDHHLARRLLEGRFGNMVCFELDGGTEEVNTMIRELRGIPYAPTLGDVSTTISHPASSSHRGLSAGERAELGISEGFIRLSVGIEDVEILMRDFEQAIRTATENRG